MEPLGGDDGELHLDGHAGDVGLVADMGVVDRCGGLAAVDDLQVVDAADCLAAAREGREVDLRGGGGDAVVVGEESLRVREEGVADAAVDLALGLQERADVELEQPGAVLAVEGREGAAGQDRQEDREVPVGVGRGQTRQRVVELDDDRLAECAGRRHPVEAARSHIS